MSRLEDVQLRGIAGSYRGHVFSDESVLRFERGLKAAPNWTDVGRRYSNVSQAAHHVRSSIVDKRSATQKLIGRVRIGTARRNPGPRSNEREGAVFASRKEQLGDADTVGGERYNLPQLLLEGRP